jgi:hypothetical protein
MAGRKSAEKLEKRRRKNGTTPDTRPTVQSTDQKRGAEFARRTQVFSPRAVLPCALALACSGSLPLPSQTVAHDDAFLDVPYPPPAALSELVPESPANDAVWVDGGWVWRGRYYVWDRGGWLRAPAGLRFVPWRLRYRPNGQAQFAKSHWVDARGERARPPPFLRPAATPPNEVTAEFQTGR